MYARSHIVPLLLLPLALSAATDWPQWRGPMHNGVLPDGPRLVESVPAEGFPVLWESESIPSNDDGGLSSPVIAGGKVYLSVVWHKDEPSATRQIGELVLRQLGWQNVGSLGAERVAKMEEARMSLGPAMRGKKLEDFADEWVKANLNKKQQQLLGNSVKNRFRKGKLAIPVAVFETLEKTKARVFASEEEMKQWLASQNWSEEVVNQIVAAVPPTKRVAEDVVLCLDLANGHTLWKTAAPGEPTGRGSSSTPSVAEGKVFALGSTHAYCLDAKSGQQLWAVPLAQKGAGSSPLYFEGLVFLNDKHLVALDPATGKEVWHQEKAGGGNSSPVPWVSGGRNFVICNGRAELTAVDEKTGEVAWSVPGSGESTPAVVDDVLAVQTRKPDVGFIAYKLTPQGATKLWNYPMDPLRTQSSPIIHDGLIYLVDDNNSFCFDADNGSQRWQEPINASISSPVLADGKIFFSANSGNTVVIMKPDAGGRTELGRATVRGAWVPSPAIADGKLVMRMKDKLKCFDIAAKAP